MGNGTIARPCFNRFWKWLDSQRLDFYSAGL